MCKIPLPFANRLQNCIEWETDKQFNYEITRNESAHK